jgi:endonuclease III-like uncharacterized protein
MKKCSRCSQEKVLEEFYKSKGYYKNPCKECSRKYYHNIKDTERYKEQYLRASLLRSYGITLEQRNEMIENQESKCKICVTEFTKYLGPCVDHCHSTKKVRGILCAQCNLIIGQLKDNVQIAKNIVKYLGE